MRKRPRLKPVPEIASTGTEVILPLDKERSIVLDVASGFGNVQQVAQKYGVPVAEVQNICKQFAHVLDPRMGEIALADTRMWVAAQMPVYNPSSLVTRKGLQIFDEMRKDDQIKAALWFKKLAAVSSGWEILSPEGEDEEHKPVKFFKKVFTSLTQPLEHVLSNGVLTALDFGFSLSELVFEKIETGDFAGLIGLKDIKTKAPHSIKFKIDKFGNLEKDGIIQTTGEGRGDVPLPAGKFLLFVYQGEFGNPYGKSDLESAYSKWWIKENAYRWLAMLLERFGVPPIFALYDPNTMNPQQVNALQTVIERIQAATAGAIPRASKEGLELWAPELAGQTGRVFIPALEMLNRDIARSLLMPGLMGLSPDQAVGSFARARVEFDVFILMLEHIRSQVAGIMNHQLVIPLSGLNFGVEPDKAPIFKFLPLTDDMRLEIFNLWTSFVAAKVVTPTQEDEIHIRKAFGFPTIPKQPLEPTPPPEDDGEDKGDEGEEEPEPKGSDGSEGDEMDSVDTGEDFGSFDERSYYDPDQPRDEDGKWSGVGGGGSERIPSKKLVSKVVNKLEGFGARQIWGGQITRDPDLDLILKSGEFYSPGKLGVKVLPMTDGQCHWNVAKAYKKGAADSIVIGYAMDSKGEGWFQHTWGLKNGKIVETTPINRSSRGYFGAKLSKVQAKAFVKWTEINEPGEGRVRRAFSNAREVAEGKSDDSDLKLILSKGGSYPKGDWRVLLDQGEKKLSDSHYYRAKTKFEKEVDFKQIEDELDALEKRTLDAIVPELINVRDRFLKYVEQKFDLDAGFVRNLRELRGLNAVSDKLFLFLQEAYNLGSKIMAKEIGVSRQAAIKVAAENQTKEHAEAPNFRPRDAQRYLKAKTFWITGLIDQKIREKARGILLNAIGTGEALPKTIQKLKDTFEPYVGDPNVIRDDDVVSPSRLETIVRTNATDAFNQGRVVEARRAGEFLVGFQYSAVLDQVTTEVCRFLDGKVFRPDDPLLDTLRPPRHFNCRSTLVPVSIDEEVKEDDFITGKEAAEALELSGEDFGGNARSTGSRGLKFTEDLPHEYKLRQRGDEWCVVSEDGSKNLGCYPTKEKAEERLAQIERIKAIKGIK